MAGEGRVAAVSIELIEGEPTLLQSPLRRRKTARGPARCARIVLLLGEGQQNKRIATRL